MAGFDRERGRKTCHKGRIWGVYLAPEKRGEGLGQGLLERLLERAHRIEGVEQISLSVTATQSAAIHLYRSLGFQSFGREPRALRISGRFIDEEYMVLRLKPANEMSERSTAEIKSALDFSVQDASARQPSPRTAKPRDGY